ncbi:MAG TPA: AAA family ATPase [Bacillota bacterium]|nr:AAA family ATPase [Bacillota bacterium]
MKLLVVFAGPNGSGKSTLISEVANSPHFPEYFFSPDELVNSLQFREIDDLKERYLSAMEYAKNLRRKIIRNGLDLAFETVFSTEEKLNFLRYAKQHGYYIELVFITTRDAAINCQRVAQRVASGGHDVPTEKVFSRYEKSMKLLPKIIQIADTVKVYDNSEATPRIVFFKQSTGECSLLNSGPRVDWPEERIVAPLLKCGFLKERPKEYSPEETERFMEQTYALQVLWFPK